MSTAELPPPDPILARADRVISEARRLCAEMRADLARTRVSVAQISRLSRETAALLRTTAGYHSGGFPSCCFVPMLQQDWSEAERLYDEELEAEWRRVLLTIETPRDCLRSAAA